MDPATPAVPPRRHPLVKASFLLLVILILVLGGACLVPTLMHKYFVSVNRSALPNDVQRLGALITDITMPEDFVPDDSVELNQFGELTRAVKWRHKTKNAIIVVFELPQDFDATATIDIRTEVTRFPFAQVAEQPFFAHPYGGAETEEVEIRGVKSDFTITGQQLFPGVLPAATTPAIEAIGTFPSKSRKQAGLRYCGEGDRKALGEFLKSIR